MIFSPFILALLSAGRGAHGADLATKWLCYAPALIMASVGGYFEAGLYGLAGFVPVLAVILLFFNGANADNALAYMYRQQGSTLRNVVQGYAWRVGLCVLLVLSACFFIGWEYSLLTIPMKATLGLIAWTAKDNREYSGYNERKTRKNFEISEGIAGGVNAAALWGVLMKVAGHGI